MKFPQSDWDMLRETLQDWPVGTIIGIVGVIAFLLLIFLVIYLIYLGLKDIADTWLVKKKVGFGVIVKREFVPEHTESRPYFNPVLKICTTQAVTVDDEWFITVELDRRQDILSVTKDFYERSRAGDKIKIKYIFGRFTKMLHIKAFYS